VGVGCEAPPVLGTATEAVDAEADASPALDGAGVGLAAEISGIGVLDRVAATVGCGVVAAVEVVAPVLEVMAGAVVSGAAEATGVSRGAGVT
jgi:hypothetical protein